MGMPLEEIARRIRLNGGSSIALWGLVLVLMVWQAAHQYEMSQNEKEHDRLDKEVAQLTAVMSAHFEQDRLWFESSAQARGKIEATEEADRRDIDKIILTLQHQREELERSRRR